jgi:phosphatidate cytidylyltransferase
VNGLLKGKPRSELWLRVVSTLVLLPLAIFSALIGGWFFASVIAFVSALILYEWQMMVGNRHPLIIGSSMSICAIAVLMTLVVPARLEIFLVFILAGTVLIAFSLNIRGKWLLGGILYALLFGLPTIALRLDPLWGFSALFAVAAVVWTSDIAAYFGGRTIGGPKLWIRFSPKKTWSGAVSGLLGGAVAMVLAGYLSGVTNLLPLAILGALLSAIAQSGDMFESGLKRKFDLKDSGKWIPGHGGFMDRLDGFLAAIVVSYGLGVARAGWSAPGEGLLIW